jgi:hypothetical protein
MPRTLMPTPDDPRPDFQALLADAQLDFEGRALLEFLCGDRAPAIALQASPCPPPGQDTEPQPVVPPSEPASPDASQPTVPDEDGEPADHDRLTYLPLAPGATPSCSTTWPLSGSCGGSSVCSAMPSAPRPTPVTAATTPTTY